MKHLGLKSRFLEIKGLAGPFLAKMFIFLRKRCYSRYCTTRSICLLKVTPRAFLHTEGKSSLLGTGWVAAWVSELA